jgi:Histidine kinase-, DNA gyrase B-, and HSP90-like ATPase
MKNIQIIGTTQINAEGIKKHFKSLEPWQAISELVWNGFDADAKLVEARIFENGIHGAERVTIFDNGTGIDLDTHEETFGRFNDSRKKDDSTLHGSHGRGRLTFHRLCKNAVWRTKSSTGSGEIAIDSASIQNYAGASLPESKLPQEIRDSSTGTGTLVELSNFTDSIEVPDRLAALFSSEFGWYLALNPGKQLMVNGEAVAVPTHELRKSALSFGGFDFDNSIFRWDEKPSSEKSYVYLLNSSGKTVARKLSTLNHKSPFHASIYVQSAWADSFAPEGQDLANPDAVGFDSDVWKKVAKELDKTAQDVYADFLRKQFEKEIAGYVVDGIFPTYAGLAPDYKRWRFANTKNILRAIYVADPTALISLKKKQKKIIVRLLDRLAISNENDAIFEVLNSVLDLSPEATETFADQLRHATLESIVATIEILQKRTGVADRLRLLMNQHYKDVRETPDLQEIIESNTWLFGHQYETLGAEEDTFTKIAKGLRDAMRDINNVGVDDLDESDRVEVEGAKRQTDLFLARKVVQHDSFGQLIYRCIVVEIKRPSISLNIKHLRQLDDYAGIIKRHAEFSSEKMHFELILIGRKISLADTEIASRMRTHAGKGQMGLVSEDDRMKRYVLNWYTLLDSFALSNQTMLDALKFKRENLSDLTKGELMADLRVGSA